MSNHNLSRSLRLTLLLIPFYLLAKYLAWFCNLLAKTGLLGVIPTSDSILGFLSKDISTVISWVILLVIGYRAEATVSRGLFGQFKGKQLMDVITVLYGSLLGVILVMYVVGPWNPNMLLTSILYSNFLPIIVTLLFMASPLCLIFNRVLIQESRIRRMEGPVGHFWTLVGQMENKNMRKEYVKAGYISNKLIRKITRRVWTFAPGLLSVAIALYFGVLFAILSLSSLIFLASVVLWTVWHLRSPEAEKDIFASLHGAVSKDLLKGLLGHVLIIGGFWVTVVFFFYPITTVILESTNLQMLHLALPFAYLFYFWYRQGKRLPVFVSIWKEYQDSGKEILIPSLPIGGYPLFVIFCCLSLANLLVFSAYCPSFIFWILSLPISCLAGITILLSLKQDKKRVSLRQVQADNILIVIAVLVQLICTDLTFWMLLEDFSFDFSLLIGPILIFAWFLADWQRFLKARYKDKPITELILRYSTYPIGFSPILIPRITMFDLMYIGGNLLWGLIFYIELVGVLSVPKSLSVNKGELED